MSTKSTAMSSMNDVPDYGTNNDGSERRETAVLPPTSIDAMNSCRDTNQNYQQCPPTKFTKVKNDQAGSCKDSSNNNVSSNQNRKYVEENVIVYSQCMANNEERHQHSKHYGNELPQHLLTSHSNAAILQNNSHTNDLMLAQQQMTAIIPNSSFNSAYKSHQLSKSIMPNNDDFKMKQEPDIDMTY
jgi:hypothetical protein